MNAHPLPQSHWNATTAARSPRLLIFIVAYQAETTVRDVLSRIPHSLADHYDIEVLVIDDGSGDRTLSGLRRQSEDRLLLWETGDPGPHAHAPVHAGLVAPVVRAGRISGARYPRHPAPFPLALGHGRAAGLLLRINKSLIHLSKDLFSYQIFMIPQPQPSLESLLQTAEEHSAVRAAS
jgi:hypothetical protein